MFTETTSDRNRAILSLVVSSEEKICPDTSVAPTTLPTWPPGVLSRSGENSFGIAVGRSAATVPMPWTVRPMPRAANPAASTGPAWSYPPPTILAETPTNGSPPTSASVTGTVSRPPPGRRTATLTVSPARSRRSPR